MTPRREKIPWAIVVERVRASGDAGLNALLDRYQARRFSDGKACWVAGAQRLIARKAAEKGIVAKEAEHV
jgi:hypothetical protein